MARQVVARPKSQPRLLIVDDDANVALTLQAVMEQDGYRVWSANSAEEADAIITSQELDVALVDLRLGEASGIDVLQSLRTRQSDCVPVMLTGYASLESAVDAIRHGVFDYLVKPCELSELRKTLKAAVEKADMTRSLRERQQRLASGKPTDLTQELQSSLETITSEGVVVRDVKGRVTYANDAAARLLGYASESELKGTELQAALANVDLLDQEGEPVAGERLPWRRALNGIHQPSAVFRLRRRDGQGTERTAHVRSMPLFRSNGAVDFEITTITDVTEQARAGQGLRILAEAGELLGKSHDAERGIAGVADLVVPAIADWCAIAFLATDDDPQRLVVRHREVSTARGLEAFLKARLSGDSNGGGAARRLLSPAQPEIHPEVSPSIVEALSASPDDRALLEHAGVKSLMVLPLVTHGAVLGAMVFASGASGRIFDSHDLSLAHEIARRCALATENARLLRREQAARRVADVWQRVRSAQYAVTQVILDATSVRDAIPQLLACIGQSLKVEPVRLWTEAGDGTFVCAVSWPEVRGATGGPGDSQAAPSERRKFQSDVLRGNRAMVLAESQAQEVLIPVVTRRGTVAVIEFQPPAGINPDQEFFESLTGIGARIGLFIDRKEFEGLVRDLSTPVLPVDERLLLVPLVGTLDADRATQLIDRVLDAVRVNRARAVVVDLTGVAPIDAFVAGQLLKMVSAARLLGAHVIVSGISPDVCETLVRMQLDTRRLQTASDLLSGLEEARRLLAQDTRNPPPQAPAAPARLATRFAPALPPSGRGVQRK